MATLEDEIRDLKERNNELVQKVQFWKVAAANKENEKLELMKEINELRLKLSRIRSGGAAQARKLEAALQSTSEEALTHLVNASSAVAHTIELAKTYMQDRLDLDYASPRWSAIGGTPSNEKVHRVPPMLIGGQSIQPVVSLSRTMLNPRSNSHSRTIVMSRSPNQNQNVTERALPMHMLQDVYIPLTRIDVTDIPGNNMETETESNDLDNSVQDLDDSGERSLERSQNMSEGDDFETSRILEAVREDSEPEDVAETPPRSRVVNPLEGPSWLLDPPSNSNPRPRISRSKPALEPDSTTRDESSAETPPLRMCQIADDEASLVAPAFSPTVRRRKRASPAASPAPSPRPATARRNSNSGRVLKVLVAKMRLDSDSDSDSTPPKRPYTDDVRLSRDMSPSKHLLGFDAPSPNGTTDARVIVLEQLRNMQSERGSGEPTLVASVSDSRLSQDRKSKPTHTDPMGLGDCHPHAKDGQNRLANDTNFAGEHSRTRTKDDEIMVVTYRGGRVSENSVENTETASGSQERTGVSNRDESRLGSVGDSRVGSMGEVTGMSVSVGLDGRDSDSSTEQPREGRTRRPRKKVVYKEKPLNRKMRR